MSRPPFRPFEYVTSHPQGIPTGVVAPTPEFVREVEFFLLDNPTSREIAQWVADRIEEHGAQFARPVVTLKGNGPFCSYCGAIGPICGHPERSISASEATIEVAQ